MFYRTSSPSGPLPCFHSTLNNKPLSRARVSLTTSCPGRLVSSLLLPNHTRLMLSRIRDSPLPLPSTLLLLPNTRDFSRFVYPALFYMRFQISIIWVSVRLSVDTSHRLSVRPSVRSSVPKVRRFVRP